MTYKIIEHTDRDDAIVGAFIQTIAEFSKLKLAKNFIKAYAKVLSKSATKITVADDHIEAVMPNGFYKFIEIKKQEH